jgi:hypothetical protein
VAQCCSKLPYIINAVNLLKNRTSIGLSLH